ncbi:MAG: PAS domain-containing protein [Candidatus Methanoculleus thermohydrogenotrophicum]|nr:PAS domain-containing protein [Candidatus Methanoculleus thermohydrogenotrophicum]
MSQQRIRETMNQAQVSVNIFNHIQQPTLVLDHEGRVVIWNDSIAEYTGVAAGDIMGKGSYAHAKVLFGERRPTLANYILAQSDPGSDYYRLLAHEGEGLLAESRIPLVSGKKVACMATPLYDPAGGQIGALETIRDISEERTGRMSPGTSEEEIQILARSLPDMIFKLDRDGVFLRFLWTGGQEMGIDPAEITGRTPHALFPEEEADFLSGAARRVIESEEAISETRSFLWHGKQRSFQITIHPLHDATGETTAAAGVARDITRDLYYERTLQETNQLSTLYLDLLGTDIYNTSMVAATVIEMLRERLSGEEAELAQRVKNTIEQGINVIKNVELLNTLKKHHVRIEPVDLDSIIRGQIRRYTGIDIRYEGGSCMVWANPLLEHVVSNLISNSIKFGGMKVRIDIGVVETGDTVTLSIADTGIGIPDHLKLSIFDRFNGGSKAASGSRGLGLHIVKTLVNQYGGRVWAADRVPGKPEEGAAIKMILQKC